jgi:hypothetical protein
MKKFGFIALAMLIAGYAFASSLAVPWFQDENKTNMGVPPSYEGVMGVVFLHNNENSAVECTITYYTQDGVALPMAGSSTFEVAAFSTVAFRPGCRDEWSTSNNFGQEAASGAAVPDRPRISTIPGGNKSNGSIVVGWNTGNTGSIQGIYVQTHRAGTTYLQYGVLLPPGVD